MGPVDSPAVQELSETIQFVIPSEDRDFSRPMEPFMANDVGMSDDEVVPEPYSVYEPDKTKDKTNDTRSNFIKQVQQALKGNPIGPKYTGPIDGQETRHLKDIAMRFGWDIKNRTGKSIVITPGDRISESAFVKAWLELQKHLKLKKSTGPKKDQTQEEKNASIEAFKLFFSKAQPIIGKLFTPTGDYEKDLISLIAAAKQTESIIAKAIDSNKVGGMIYSKSFNTTPADVKGALDLIAKQQ